MLFDWFLTRESLHSSMNFCDFGRTTRPITPYLLYHNKNFYNITDCQQENIFNKAAEV